MRFLVSSTPAFGHLIPLLPVARAAIAAGHDLAVLTAIEMRPFVEAELPGAKFLAAGASAAVIIGTAAEEDGVDLSAVTPEDEGSMFGRVRVRFALEDSLSIAEAWRPDVVLSESFDRVGPIIAGAQEIPWIQFGVGPGAAPQNAAAIEAAAAPFARERGVVVLKPFAYVDACPPLLKPRGWSIPVPTIQTRAEPFRSVHGTSAPAAVKGLSGTALITLGTIFSDPVTLNSIVNRVISTGHDVLATKGLVLSEIGDPADPAQPSERVHWVGFEPLADLLEAASVVVSAGGSGTVFAAAATGKPLVLFPQGADQHHVSGVAETAGIAVVVHDVDQIPSAIDTALHSPNVRSTVARVAAEIAAMPSAAATLTAIVQRLQHTGRF